MALKPRLPFLELMLTSVCNLTCTGCSTYSDIPSRGYTPWSDIKHWLAQWLQRFEIEDIGPMGGEPLIYPDVLTMLEDLRSMFPRSKIRFPTNGTLIHKHWSVIDWLHKDGNATLKITEHIQDADLKNNIRAVWDRFRWEPVFEYGIHRWQADSGLRLQINRPKTFTQTFQGSYATAQPWQSDPAQAFENCHQPTCPLLYRARIYKCSTSALLPDALAKFGSPNAALWKPYFDHDNNGSVGLSDNADTLKKFATNFGRPHRICAQCPTKYDPCTFDHTQLVKFR